MAIAPRVGCLAVDCKRLAFRVSSYKIHKKGNMSTNYFFDTEFIEDGKTIDLISIGIVCEDGRELYLCNSECEFWRASEWVWENVLSTLVKKSHTNLESRFIDPELWHVKAAIKAAILDFCKDTKPKFWAYYADYDWVVFCQLFGTMMDLPDGFPMYCRDIKQYCDDLGNPDLPKQGKGEHNALADARWNKTAYEFLRSVEKG